jgi:hypothetical protein
MAKKTSFLTAAVAWFIVFIVFVGIVAVIFTDDRAQPQAQRSQAQKPAPDRWRSAARGACREFLTRALNDPDSAKFDPSSRWYTEREKNGTILVQPRARAKNAYGAMIYGVWDCVLVEEGDKLRLLSLKQIQP